MCSCFYLLVMLLMQTQYFPHGYLLSGRIQDFTACHTYHSATLRYSLKHKYCFCSLTNYSHSTLLFFWIIVKLLSRKRNISFTNALHQKPTSSSKVNKKKRVKVEAIGINLLIEKYLWRQQGGDMTQLYQWKECCRKCTETSESP